MAKKLIAAESALKLLVGLGLVVLFAGTALALSSSADLNVRQLEETEEGKWNLDDGNNYGTFRLVMFLIVTAFSVTSVYCCYAQIFNVQSRADPNQYHPECTCHLQPHPYSMQYVQPVQGIPMEQPRQYVPPSQ